MSSYTCENFQLLILYNIQFHHMVLKRLPEDLNSIFWLFFKKRIVLFFFILLPLSCFSRSYKIVDRKLKFLRRGILRDEFLHVWELSTFHSVQLSISSYGLKTFSHRPKVLFDFCEKRWKMAKIQFLGRGVFRYEFLHWWELSEWHSRHFSIFHMAKNSIFAFWYSKNKEITFT